MHRTDPPGKETSDPTADGAGNDFRRYSEDPLGFVRDVLGQQCWAKQEEILLALRDHPQVTVRSSHGVGKTFTAAVALLWWVYSHRPSLVLSTAPTARQVEALLWREVNRLFARAKRSLPGRCLQTRLHASLDQQALGLTTNEPEKFAGWHSSHLLVIVDEASGVPEPIFEVIQGTLTSAHCRLLLIGNPTQASGYFHQSHQSPGWQKLRISAYDTPNFQEAPGSKLLALRPTEQPREAKSQELRAHPYPCPWLVTPEWVEARKQEWGEDSTPFRVRVLGEFPRQSADTLFALEWIEAAEARSFHPRMNTNRHEWEGEQAQEQRTSDSGSAELQVEATRQSVARSSSPDSCSFVSIRGSIADEVVLGVDVARFGDCETVVAGRRGETLLFLESWQGADLMQSCGRVVQLCGEWRPGRVVVDAVGLGAGVVDRLRELKAEGLSALQGTTVVAFESGGRAARPEQYVSRRDEAYLALRDRFRDSQIALAVRSGPLTGQLCALKYGFTSRGQIKVESKDELRRRGLSSPDHADAVALAFSPEPAPARPLFLPTALGGTRPARRPCG